MSFTFTVDPGQLQPAPRIPVTANSAPLGAMVGGILHAYRPGGGYNSIGRHLVGDEVSARRLYAPTGNAVETQGVLTLSEAEYRPTDWHDALPNSITIDPIALADLATVHHEGTVAPTVTWILASGVVGDAVRVDVRWGWVAPPVSTKLLWRVYASPDGAR